MKLGSAPLIQLAIFSTPSPYSHCLCSVPLILSSFLVEQLSSLTCHMKHLNPGGATQLCFSLIICKGPFQISSPGFSGMYNQGPGLSILQNEMKT
ncbi:uncharacterized protein BO87DRAFT_128510 [Aspergillus neoniger CBS 115656]|uniref:Uncharacterized protein n=1 Tax=Aspergillus neoniger (strain CBS 115656) TaxID=1448310 RepID=A0A318Z4B3_ASPNB|nr:hypothetical protein BO87DRAFT_128510 [Aspergillus neoniger CBS 115656]PYH38540.1 hypothetical protein BO87DRAFT_128510 [Aspergillus neoniger CBS 115656]